MGFNDYGVVAGYVSLRDGLYPAMLVNGELVFLPVHGWANAINNRGEVVGLAEAGRWYHGFIWDATDWRFLPVPEGSGRSFADDINERGQDSMSIDLGDANTGCLWRAARVQG